MFATLFWEGRLISMSGKRLALVQPSDAIHLVNYLHKYLSECSGAISCRWWWWGDDHLTISLFPAPRPAASFIFLHLPDIRIFP
jgi:hypothetical protein